LRGHVRVVGGKQGCPVERESRSQVTRSTINHLGEPEVQEMPWVMRVSLKCDDSVLTTVRLIIIIIIIIAINYDMETRSD
jgi:hypothetical protein